MQREIIKFDTEAEWLKLRKNDITSTGCSAMLGVSTYKTKLELWHEFATGLTEEFKPNERMKWGNKLESVIAEACAEEHKLEIKPMKTYWRLPEYRLGSSFDFEIIHNPRPGYEGKRGILEIKNVDWLVFKDKWIIEDKEIVEAPPYIEVQTQQQLLVSGYDYTMMGVFVGGNNLVVAYRDPDKEIHDLILSESVKFWESIIKNERPPIDFEKDAEFISRMYQAVQPGTVINADLNPDLKDLCIKHYKLGKDIKSAEEVRDGIKAKILTLIGDTEKATSELFSLSAGYIGPAEVSYLRKGYRNFRVTPKAGLKE